MQYVAPAARTWRIAIGVGCGRTAEYAPPAGAAPEPVGIVDGMAGLVTHDSVTPLPVAAFHLSHHRPLQPLQARVSEIERHGKAGDAIRRKPVGRQPHVRPESQATAFEVVVQPLDLEPQRAAPESQAETAEAKVQKRLIVAVRPTIVQLAGCRRLSGGNHSSEDTRQGHRARPRSRTPVSVGVLTGDMGKILEPNLTGILRVSAAHRHAQSCSQSNGRPGNW
jgi:hypothetical protein